MFKTNGYAKDLPRHIIVLACPFFTLTDSIPSHEIVKIWKEGLSNEFSETKFIVSENSFALLKEKFGDPSKKIAVNSDSVAIEKIAKEPLYCGFVPFHLLRPDLKLIKINGISPLDKSFIPQSYPLSFPADEHHEEFFPDRITSVLLTGTTALVRLTAFKMQENGNVYPGLKIKQVFENSDIRHISNEASFWRLCPDQNRLSVTMQFCSKTEFFELYDFLNVNLIELTGNHLRDYDWQPFLDTINLIEEKGIPYYGAGKSLDKVHHTAKIELNGNKFVFLGCNAAGPEHVFATEELPGALRCDFDQLSQEIATWREKGFLPIVTLQYFEIYSRSPSERQIRDFNRLREAGAIIVSGSQAHYAQTMAPFSDSFIHYGLGNLFFDQMDEPIVGTRQEFLDRYAFYKGKLLQAELITAMLEDDSQPRLMTAEERYYFLSELFAASTNSSPINTPK